MFDLVVRDSQNFIPFNEAIYMSYTGQFGPRGMTSFFSRAATNNSKLSSKVPEGTRFAYASSEIYKHQRDLEERLNQLVWIMFFFFISFFVS